MGRRRYYTCPRCSGPMTGSLESDGRERWTCWRAEGCDCHDRPPDAPKRLRGAITGPTRPARNARFSRVASTSREPEPATAQVIAAPSAAFPWRPFLAALAVLMALALGLRFVATSSPVGATRPPTTIEANALRDGGGPGGPQYNGYAVACADGWTSHSGGVQGACSGHGGIAQAGRPVASLQPFGNTSGVRCKDGTFSNAGGRQGACSHHGGVSK